MADTEESLGDLSPREGISDYTIDVAGLDNAGRGSVTVRFKIERMDEQFSFPASLSFTVGPGDDGLEGAVGRAYDQLILALRQMLYHAAVERKQYAKRSALLSQAGSPAVDARAI